LPKIIYLDTLSSQAIASLPIDEKGHNPVVASEKGDSLCDGLFHCQKQSNLLEMSVELKEDWKSAGSRNRKDCMVMLVNHGTPLHPVDIN
jgi:hypothetical protein